MNEYNSNFLHDAEKDKIKSEINRMNNDDLKRQIGNMNRNDVIRKLRSMGLGSIADKYANTSDEELLRLIGRNPDILRKINDMLK